MGSHRCTFIYLVERGTVISEKQAHHRCKNLWHSPVTQNKENKEVNIIDPNPSNSYKNIEELHRFLLRGKPEKHHTVPHKQPMENIHLSSSSLSNRGRTCNKALASQPLPSAINTSNNLKEQCINIGKKLTWNTITKLWCSGMSYHKSKKSKFELMKFVCMA